MKFNKKLLLTLFFILIIVNIIWDIWLYFLPSHNTIWNYLYNAIYGTLYLLAGTIPIYYAKIFDLKSRVGKMLLFSGLAMLSFEGGLIIWVYYNLILRVPIPFPSWADASFMLFYPFMTLGVIYLLKIYKQLITKKLLRDSIIIFIASFLLIFGLFSRPDLSANLSLLEKFMNIYYPMGDVMTLTMALIALRVGGGKIHPSLYIFCIGLLLQTTADLLFTYRTAKVIYWNGDIADYMYTVAAFVIGIGLVKTIHNLNQPTPTTNTSPRQ